MAIVSFDLDPPRSMSWWSHVTGIDTKTLFKFKAGTKIPRKRHILAIQNVHEHALLAERLAIGKHPSKDQMIDLLEDCGVENLCASMATTLETYANYITGKHKMPQSVQRLWWWTRAHTKRKVKKDAIRTE